MDDLVNFGTAIYSALVPTIKAFTPHLRANAEAIKSAPKSTHAYGDHPRQLLDVYEPLESATKDSTTPAPILVFFYGGGLANGDKVVGPPFPDELIYTNLGYFFSQKLGFRTIIPDYRLLRHDARFPSGGEDVGKAVQWIIKTYGGGGETERQDLFLMGNSAGGVHTATWLFADAFADDVDAVVKGSTGVKLKGVVFLGVPFDFQNAEPQRSETLTQYFGKDEGAIDANSPYGLMKTLPKERLDERMPRLLVLWSSLDPEEEILKPQRRFVTMWKEMRKGEGMETGVLEGHNHLSPPFGLGTGLKGAEEWGYMAGKWMTERR